MSNPQGFGGTRRCQVCRRPFWADHDEPPFVCGPACAAVERNESLRRLGRWAVLHELTRRVGPRAVLCLEALPTAELDRRREKWTAPPYKSSRGTLYKYIKNVKSASEGCVTDE